jgi:hypothetical protein
MEFQLSQFCQGKGYSKNNSPFWSDISDALTGLRGSTGSINIEIVQTKTILNIQSDDGLFLVLLIERNHEGQTIINIKEPLSIKEGECLSPTPLCCSRQMISDFNFVSEIARKFFVTGKIFR